MDDRVLLVGLLQKERYIFVIFENAMAKILLGAGVRYLGESDLSLLSFLVRRDLQCPGGFSKSYVLPQQQKYGT